MLRLVSDCPSTLDGAAVICVADLTESAPTGRTRHSVAGLEVGGFASLAIAKYPQDSGFYLFYCDAEWAVITDTYHDSVTKAVDQAEFEFSGVQFTELSA
jgi:hypothetical protein